MRPGFLCSAALGCALPLLHAIALAGPNVDWPAYGGSASGDRFSPLTQIQPENLQRLREAWRVELPGDALQTSPLVIDGMAYLVAPDQSVIAVEGSTGRTRWRHASGQGDSQPVRGLAYWTDGRRGRLYTSEGTTLLALDARTGAEIAGFGKQGRIDLRQGLGVAPRSVATFLTSPAVVWRDLVIVGFRTSESRPAAPGAIRAYDARSGRLRWTFRTVPGGMGAGNAWAGMAVDAARGIVYAPTGSMAPDFDGADRPGDNLYANSLLALDARTGRRRWHFQGVHHDIWDRDFPSPPSLLTVTHRGRRIDAVAQASKQGYLFVFDRVTGEPLFPIEERPAPASPVPGEQTSPTQPHPVAPAAFARQSLTEAQLTHRTPEAHAAAVAQFRGFRNGPLFTPLAIDQQTVVLPGFDGGAEWGGSAVDAAHGILYLNSNDIAWTGGLTAAPAAATGGTGSRLYLQHCSVCHGVDRKGQAGVAPALDDIGSTLLDWQIQFTIKQGKGRMPGFPQLEGSDLQALVLYLRDTRNDTREVSSPGASTRDLPRYLFTGYRKFMDPDGYPAVEPPWGTLNAIDLNTGDYLWRVPLGEYPELQSPGSVPTGSENYGGPLVTASGLLFIGATVQDRQFRAFDTGTGRELWRTTLPYAGVATPITYMVDGRQYLLIATSSSRSRKSPQGAAYVAFALDGPAPTP